jgi:superfamily I DNA and/or RNA helicase
VSEAQAALRALAALWKRERLATRQQAQEQREQLAFGERVRRGLALKDLTYENTEPAGPGRCQLWFVLPQSGQLEQARISVGDPVVLWSTSHPQQQGAVVARRGQTRLAVVVDSEYQNFVEQGPVQLDLEAPEVTFDRGDAAISLFLKDERLSSLRELLFGEREPVFDELPELEFRDTGLNENQREAVRFALSAQEVALIHGPPGTGKTRTLVEVIRQQLLSGRSVLVTAASNIAVDHLARQLIRARVKPLRLGHPTRVADDLRERTAEHLMQSTEEYALARQWQNEARALRERHHKKQTRARRPSGGSERDLLRQADRLNADARRMLKEARAKVLRRSRVVCTTAAGADSTLLGATQFDVVVLDEATQAPDPIALAALARANIAILAGDPCQLSPTVLDVQAARDGLSSTLFERKSKGWKPEATQLLKVQYRMHQVLMRFVSDSMYGGKLQAHPSVAQRRLEELPGVGRDPERDQPWLLLDTSGSGWEEQTEPDSLSTYNPEQAECTAREVRRLIQRGLSPRDIAAITPYSAQVRLLRRLLEDCVEEGLEIGTVDGFQGREKEAVVVDLVRSNASGTLGFLEDIRRTNVALTRAKRALVVICDGSTLARHAYYQSMLEAAEREGAWKSCGSET